jgi:hypothetical protein
MLVSIWQTPAKHQPNAVHCAELRICVLRRAGLSADDRRIAVLKPAFEAKKRFFSLC